MLTRASAQVPFSFLVQETLHGLSYLNIASMLLRGCSDLNLHFQALKFHTSASYVVSACPWMKACGITTVHISCWEKGSMFIILSAA